MTEHDAIRALLSLAASGDLDARDENRVAAHALHCAECAAELERWNGIQDDLRRLPTPQPPFGVVMRARAMAQAELAAQIDQRADQVNLVFLLLFAWAMALGGWMLFRLFGGGLMQWLQVFGGRTWVWMAVYAGVGWLASSFIAVILLGQQHRNARRVV